MFARTSSTRLPNRIATTTGHHFLVDPDKPLGLYMIIANPDDGKNRS
jgi:hypothetical protein